METNHTVAASGKKDNTAHIRKKVLLPLISSLIFLLCIFLVGTYWLQQQHLNETVRTKIHDVEENLHEKIETESLLLVEMINSLLEHPPLRDAWLENDREKLLQLSLPFFSKLHVTDRTIRFSFIDLNKDIFLNIHDPQRYGAPARGSVIKQAAQTMRPAHGIVLGPFGDLTLRVVVPWLLDGKVTGYIELSEDLSSITSHLKNNLHIDLIITAAKKYLDRSIWEKNQKGPRIGESWDQLSHFVIISSTFSVIPHSFLSPLINLEDCDTEEHLCSIYKLNDGMSRYRAGLAPLLDAADRDLGDLFVLIDVTEQETSLLLVSIIITVACIVLGGLLFFFFYIYLGRIEKQLVQTHESLTKEITERHGSEVKVRKHRAFLQNVLDSLAHPFYVIDAQTYEIKLANRAAGFGDYPPGATCYHLTHHRNSPCSDADHPCSLAEVISNKKPVIVEHVHYDGEGNRYDVEIHAYPIFDEEGKVREIIEYSHDITERKNAERALSLAKEAAETASRTKSEFLANISHEIRTPMNGIIGLTDILLGKGLADQHGNLMKMIKTAADQLLHIVNDVLDFSKIEAGKLKIESTPFRLSEVISQVETALQVKIREKQLDLIRGVSPEVPDNLVGDPVRLRQVLLNLMDNAVKFTERGKVELKVKQLIAPEGKNNTVSLRFSVIDTGIGISREKHRIIFESFTQADGSMTRKYGGTGLGLTISSQLVTLMGGEIGVESEPGKGSVFHFTAIFQRQAQLHLLRTS